MEVVITEDPNCQQPQSRTETLTEHEGEYEKLVGPVATTTSSCEWDMSSRVAHTKAWRDEIKAKARADKI
jgi:hypothetical protein